MVDQIALTAMHKGTFVHRSQGGLKPVNFSDKRRVLQRYWAANNRYLGNRLSRRTSWSSKVLISPQRVTRPDVAN